MHERMEGKSNRIVKYLNVYLLIISFFF